MVTAECSLLGIGLYEISDAVRVVRANMHLAGLSDIKSRETIRHWIKGYSYKHCINKNLLKPVLLGNNIEINDISVLTFADLLELHFIAAFRNEGVSVPIIRKAAECAAKLFGNDIHPFANAKFYNDGKSIFFTSCYPDLPQNFTEEKFALELNKGQTVFCDFIQPFFKERVIDASEIKQLWPMGKDHHVVLDPMRSFGQPIDDESGVPTSALANAILNGDNEQTVAKWFDVSEQAVYDAFEYEKLLRQS